MRKPARENIIDDDGAIDFQEQGRIVYLVQAGKPVANCNVAVAANDAWKVAQLTILKKRLSNEKRERAQTLLKQRIAEVEQEPNTKM